MGFAANLRKGVRVAPDHPVARLSVPGPPESKARVRFPALLLLLFSAAVERAKLEPGLLI